MLAGALLGVPAALATSHQLARMLYGLGPMDPARLGLATSALSLAAALAAYLPARRASRVDPMVALRCEWIGPHGDGTIWRGQARALAVHERAEDSWRVTFGARDLTNIPI